MRIRDKAFSQQLSSNPHIAGRVVDMLRTKWRGINPITNVVFTEAIHITVDNSPGLRTIMDDMISVPVNGWRRLKAQLFPTPYIIDRLDDPNERWRYTKRLWKAFFKAPIYRFWRWAGRTFDRDDWTQRGMEYMPNPKGYFNRTKTLDMEALHWLAEYTDEYANQGTIVCVYHQEADILYVKSIRKAE